MKRHKIVFRPGAVDKLLTLNDVNKSGLAVLLHIDYSQLWRLERGGSVGEKVIVQVLVNHPDHKFEEFFMVA